MRSRSTRFLKSEGALFPAELAAGSGLADGALDAALLELVMAGLVTNDSLAVLRGLWEQGSPRPSAPRQPFSSLEAQLAERLGGRNRNVRLGGVRRPSQQELQAAQRRVGERLGQSGRLRTGPAAAAGAQRRCAAVCPRWAGGRWCIASG